VANVQPPPNPAEPGNLRALKHGAKSARLVVPEATDLADQVLAEVAHLTECDRPAVMAWALAEVKAWRLATWLEQEGDFDSEGNTRSALNDLRMWLDRAEKARARLGLDPVSRASLNLDHARVAEHVARWTEGMNEGARLVEQAARRGELEPGS
jgi:hypothetical protein